MLYHAMWRLFVCLDVVIWQCLLQGCNIMGRLDTCGLAGFSLQNFKKAKKTLTRSMTGPDRRVLVEAMHIVCLNVMRLERQLVYCQFLLSFVVCLQACLPQLSLSQPLQMIVNSNVCNHVCEQVRNAFLLPLPCLQSHLYWLCLHAPQLHAAAFLYHELM